MRLYGSLTSPYVRMLIQEKPVAVEFVALAARASLCDTRPPT